jgi:recombination associated protein RdgC
MFFTNLLAYRLTMPTAIDIDWLQAQMATKLAREPASQEISTYGFVAPYGKDENAPLVHVSGGFWLIAARMEERVLPGSAVRDEVKKRVEAIEAEQLRKVYKRERDQLKDEVIQAFLPRAFLRKRTTYAAFDIERGLILVNTSSAKNAEDLLSTLREVIGTLPVRPLTVKIAPSAILTEWLKMQKAAPDFYVLDNCELRDTHENGGLVRCQRQDLAGDEVKMHLSTGKVCTRLALAYQDKLSFVLDDKLTLTRVKFEDVLTDQAAADGGDDAGGQFDASFVLMMLTFRAFLPALFEALGGEDVPQGI